MVELAFWATVLLVYVVTWLPDMVYDFHIYIEQKKFKRTINEYEREL